MKFIACKVFGSFNTTNFRSLLMNGTESKIPEIVCRDIKEKIAGLRREMQTNGEGKPFIGWVDLLEEDIKILKRSPSPQQALIVLTTIENLQTQVSYLASQSQKSSSIWDNIKNCIKGLSSSVWQLISRLLTLKEWSISGTVTGSILGMASGTTQLQFTFGQ